MNPRLLLAIVAILVSGVAFVVYARREPLPSRDPVASPPPAAPRPSSAATKPDESERPASTPSSAPTRTAPAAQTAPALQTAPTSVPPDAPAKHGKTFRVHGRVQSVEGGRPLAGAAVVFYGEGEDRQTASTDATGAFAFDVSPWPRTGGIVAEHAGFAPEQVRLPPKETLDRPVVLTMYPRARLTGRVTDPRGVARTDVVVCVDAIGGRDAWGNAVRSPTARHAVVDATGCYSIEDLPGGVPLQARVFPKAGRETQMAMMMSLLRGSISDVPLAEQRKTLQAGQTTVMDFALAAGAGVRGVVRDQHGALVPNASVIVTKDAYYNDFSNPVARMWTGDDAVFEFKDLPPRRYFLVVLASRNAPTRDIARSFTEVDLRAAGSTKEVNLHVCRGLFIRGTLVDPTGTPCAGRLFSRNDDDFTANGRANQRGEFRLGPMVPGAHELVADRNGFCRSTPVTAAAGATGVVVRLRAGGSIEGRVVFRATGRIGSITVDAIGARANRRTWAPADGQRRRAETEGAPDPLLLYRPFQLRALEPGEYTVVARSKNGLVGVAGPVSVATAKSTATRVRLGKGGTIRMAIPSDTAGVITVSRETGGYVYSDLATRRTPIIVPPGRYVVALHDQSGKRWERSITVAAGNATTVSAKAR